MDIGQAVAEMRKGYNVARAGWNGKGMHLALQSPNANSKMGEPYVYLHNAQGKLIPWNASQADLLAEDWTTCGPTDQQGEGA